MRPRPSAASTGSPLLADELLPELETSLPLRSMVHVVEDTGMNVRYVEARDGHSWENGPQLLYYE